MMDCWGCFPLEIIQDGKMEEYSWLLGVLSFHSKTKKPNL